MDVIELTKGRSTIVDDNDKGWLTEYRWRHHHNVSNEGYAARTTSVKGEQFVVLMHRAIWERYNGTIPNGWQIDHINGNGLDNRKGNLRLCTRAENCHNYHRRSTKRRSSRFKGVCRFGTNRWQANICKNGKRIHIGLFDSEEAAALAYDAKARELFGEFANLNFS